MKFSPSYLLLLLVFICACSPERPVNKLPDRPRKSTCCINPLDKLKGDKIMNAQTGKQRKHNFSRLRFISLDWLLSESKLYTVDSLGQGFYIINQVKTYKAARLFSVLVKTAQNKIVDFRIFQDLVIADGYLKNEEIFLLCDNWEIGNRLWKTLQQVHIFKVDSDLKDLWKYSLNNRHNFDAIRILPQGDRLFFEIHFIISSTMCYEAVNLELNMDGQKIGATATHSYCQGHSDQSMIDEIFSE